MQRTYNPLINRENNENEKCCKYLSDLIKYIEISNIKSKIYNVELAGACSIGGLCDFVMIYKPKDIIHKS